MALAAGTRTFPVHPDNPCQIEAWETEGEWPEHPAPTMAQTTGRNLWSGTLKSLERFTGLQCTLFKPADTTGPAGPAVQFLIPARKKTPGRLVLM